MKALSALHALARGFAMVEVLVAVVVLSFGLLGLAGLQASSLRNSASALQRSIATFYAADMADRLRANPAGRIAGGYDDVSAIPADPGCLSSGCTALEMAQYDAYDWGTKLAADLPGGLGRVAAAAGQYTITVLWDDERTGATGTGCDPANPADLKCFSTTIQP